MRNEEGGSYSSSWEWGRWGWMVCECVLNRPVGAAYLSVWGTHVGSDNKICMLRAFRQRVLIKVCWCFAWAMHESRKCWTISSFLLHAGQIGVAIAPILWRCQLSCACPVRSWIRTLDWKWDRSDVSSLSSEEGDLGSIICILSNCRDFWKRERRISLLCLAWAVLWAVVLCGRGEHKIAGRIGEGSLCCFVASLASLSAF